MLTVVVDTSILIDHLRKDMRARTLLSNGLQSRQIRIVASVLTEAEVLAGMRPGEEVATWKLLALFGWIQVSESIAERAGDLGRHYLRSHPGVDTVDLVIAATTVQLGASLWTRNIKHFPMFVGLKDPYASPLNS